MTRTELLLMALPATVALAGGVLAALWHPSHRARSLIQHFAAGVVLAALAVELLPEIEREHAPGMLLAGAFAVGALAMFGLKLVTERLEDGADGGGFSPGLVLATFIDVAVDGFIIGAGFAAGGETGPVLAVGPPVPRDGGAPRRGPRREGRPRHARVDPGALRGGSSPSGRSSSPAGPERRRRGAGSRAPLRDSAVTRSAAPAHYM